MVDEIRRVNPNQMVYPSKNEMSNTKEQNLYTTQKTQPKRQDGVQVEKTTPPAEENPDVKADKQLLADMKAELRKAESTLLKQKATGQYDGDLEKNIFELKNKILALEAKIKGEPYGAPSTTETKASEDSTTPNAQPPEENPNIIPNEPNNQLTRGEQLTRRQEARAICDDFFKAIDGFGTNDKLFNETMNKITKENFFDVMNYWNKSYGATYHEDFLSSFLGDADAVQKKVYGKRIIGYLESYADDKGLDVALISAKCKRLLNSGNNSELAHKMHEFIMIIQTNISQYKI